MKTCGKQSVYMRKGILILGLVLYSIAVFVGTSLSNGESVFIPSPTGTGGIDYSKQILRVKGVAPPQPGAQTPGMSRVLQLRVTKADAYRKALELIKEVQVNSDTTVNNFILESDVIRTKVEGMIRGLKEEAEPIYLNDGTIEQWYTFPMQGNFNGLIFDQIVPPGTPPQAPPVQFSQGGQVFSGLIVDARGLGVKPAMAPKVIDEDGREVYGSAYVDRKWAIEQGMAGYSKDIAAAQSNPRVTATPILVKGLKTDGQAKTDIVISNTDAGKIRANAENMTFVEKCKVMIVL
ncbi:MAG: hypothetical protein HY578_01125 [Nitrospinae bacterium]|nr:hypothetical protein [Nitrospinota bacterium]